MTSIQERLQIKREPLDKWSVREQLCLASAVARSGDQNWMSVSRALKPFGDPNRPPDWFHQKNCAAQYGSLLENVETPKRKKRTSGVETMVETPSESILRKLTRERLAELEKLLTEEKDEYVKLQEDMVLLQSGNISEEQLDRWCKEIDEEEKQKEEESITHSHWLKERELRKQEIERAWRPLVKGSPNVMQQKRKASESLESLMDLEGSLEEGHVQTQEPAKPALSPLLTSLLKSPSHAQNVATSSILHSAITSQRPINTSSTPTIASLLNSSTGVTVSPGLQQLVSTAIGQEPLNSTVGIAPGTGTSDLIDATTDTLPNLKVEDIESTILLSDDPLPEIKNEEVEVIISDLIENADIVTDPEQHLQLDDNEDIMTNLENELHDLCEEAELEEAEQAAKEENKIHKSSKETLKVDPFEFEDEPEVSQSTKSSSYIKHQEQSDTLDETVNELTKIITDKSFPKFMEEKEIKKEIIEEAKKEKHEVQPGSVEIVEVLLMEDEDIEKELNKSQIQDIVHSHKKELKVPVINTKAESVTRDLSKKEDDSEIDSPVFEEQSESVDLDLKANQTIDKDLSVSETSRIDTFTPEYSEAFFDDMAMEVNKLEKSGKALRDYSRTKKKEEKDFDILLAVEKAVNAQLEESDVNEENLSDKEYQESEKKVDSNKQKIKSETDRSNSPWTEEEELASIRNKRRYSTPATPVDSVPNSPASSIAYFEDDRDYRNWKKSVMVVYSRLVTHKYSSLFLKPITDDQAPGYHGVIYRPMDLQTLRKNIENGVIRTTPEFQRDVLLMFNNAIIYNKTNELVYNMARQMQQESIQQIQILLQAQQGDVPPRRETRTSEPGNKRKRPSEDNVRNKKKKED